MTDTANGVRIWQGDEALTTAHILSAPLATALPTDASTALNAAFKDAGRADEDGCTYSPDFSVEDVKDMSGRVLRRVCNTAHATISFALVQWTADSLKTAFGDNNVTVESDGSIAVKFGKMLPTPKAFVINVKDGDDAMRIVVPNGQVANRQGFTIKPGDPTKPQVTIDCDLDDDGNVAYIYSAGKDVE